METKVKTTLFLGILATILVLGVYMCNADAEPLHHEVQVVTGGRVDAQAFADAVMDELAFVRGSVTVYVDTTPASGATTVGVTIVAVGLKPVHYGYLRLAIESMPRKSGIVRNGYTSVRQRPSFGYARR